MRSPITLFIEKTQKMPETLDAMWKIRFIEQGWLKARSANPLYGQATESITMSAVRQIFVLLRNAALVTLVVALGFTLGEAIGLPIWLQIPCLIPAGYLFHRLSGAPMPPMRCWVPHVIAIAILVAAMVITTSLVRTHFPDLHGSAWLSILVFSVLFLPMRAFAARMERHWPFREIDESQGTWTP